MSKDVPKLCCSSCKEDIIDETKRIICSGLCNQVYHPDCTSLKKTEQKLLENDSFKWFCAQCKVITTNVIDVLTTLKNSVLMCQDQILRQGMTIDKQASKIQELLNEVKQLNLRDKKNKQDNSFSSNTSSLDVPRLHKNDVYKKHVHSELTKHEYDHHEIRDKPRVRSSNLPNTGSTSNLNSLEGSILIDEHNKDLFSSTRTTAFAEPKIKFNELIPTIMNELPENSVSTKGLNQDEEFTLVTNKKKFSARPQGRKPNQVITGTAENNEELSAAGKRAWFYVGRVKKDVEEVKLSNYISQKCTGVQNISVTKLNAIGKNLSFCVGIDFDYKDKLMDEQFWPKGILVRRFNFNFKKTSQNFQKEARNVETK